MSRINVRKSPYFARILTLAVFSIIITVILYWSQKVTRPVYGGAFTTGNTVVIDPGHGGMDGGATGVSGMLEKDCTLIISKRLDSLMAFLGIQTVMTRTDDQLLDHLDDASIRQNKISDLNARLRLANTTENAVFISVHLNKFAQSQYKGAQVFYAPNHPDSKTLAEAVQKSLLGTLNDGNTRTYKEASDIFLMKNATCPAITVECGFVSNPEEEALLKDDGYQKKLALAITGGYIEYLKEKPEG